MSKLEKILLRFTILAIVICVIIHFMAPKSAVETPSAASVARPRMFVDPLVTKCPKLGATTLGEIRPLDLDFTLKEVSYTKPGFSRSFGARGKDVRLILAKMNGGNEETEEAMEMALAYLAKRQADNGAWSPSKYPLGSTGLAVNCFLGAGYGPQTGKYKDVVAKGLKYLLANQGSTGRLNRESMYSTAIAGMSFAEAFGLTGDPVYRKAAEKLIAYLAKIQGPKGGWYYGPGPHHKLGDHYNYDTSVTGWVMMAFKSAKMAGIKIPHDTVKRYFNYAMEITYSKSDQPKGKGRPRWYRGMACYGIRSRKDRKTKKVIYGIQHSAHYTMTASTLMCRLYMGDNKHSRLIKEGLAQITTKLPESQKPHWSDKDKTIDNYLWYHAAQVGFLVGGKAWTFWNEELKKILLEHQIKDGNDKGGWNNALFKWSDRSKVYPTCLNIMILQTYYRYYK